MDCIFNELSLEEAISDKTIAINLMSELIQLCKEINNLCKKPKMKLRAIDDLRQRELSNGYTIQDWLLDKNVDSSERSLLNTLLDHPTVNEFIVREEEYMDANCKYCDDHIEKKSDGLAVAYTTGEAGVLAVSLNSHVRWDKHEIDLLCSSNGQQKKVIIKHASQKKHIVQNKCFILIIKSDSFNVPSLDNPFPNLKQSNKLVDNDWSQFQQQLDEYKDQKLSTIQEMADNVARINGYSLNNELSSLNQKIKNSRREIYETGSDRNKVYLSVDFEKGAFELCNHAGEHQGEYKFNGELSGNAKSDHKIYLKR